MPEQKPVTQVLAENLRALMDHEQYSEAALAQRAKVNPTTINNMLNQNHAAKIDSLEAVAKAFGHQAWELLLEGGPRFGDATLPRLIEDYRRSDDTGRHSILTVAELAARPYRE